MTDGDRVTDGTKKGTVIDATGHGAKVKWDDGSTEQVPQSEIRLIGKSTPQFIGKSRTGGDVYKLAKAGRRRYQ